MPLIKQSITIAILGAFLFALQLFAFTEPSSSPPLGNVPAPLNVSSSGQSKAGGLILNTGGAEIGLIIDKGKVCIGTDCRTAWPGEVPSGFVGFFNLSNCPAGWSSFSQAQGRYLVGASSGIGTTVGTALSSQENRPAGEHSHSVQTRRIFGTGGNWAATDQTPVTDRLGPPLQTDSFGVPGTPAPYIQLLACQKN